MKVALVCTSLGYVNRGFERFTSELFDLVQEELPITLFGTRLHEKKNQISFPCIKHDRWLRCLQGKARDNYYYQQLSYASLFIPYVAWKKYDLIHFSEPGLGNFLSHAKTRFGLRYKLLFSDGLGLDACSDPFFFERLDHIQALTPSHREALVRCGVPAGKITCLPYGTNAGRYQSTERRDEIRARYGIPLDKTVILSVAALNRGHKRIDYLIEETAALSGNYYLLVAGNPEEPDLIELGKKRLGGNFKTVSVAQDEIHLIYAMADIFVMTSLIEGFCLALVEAMCSGLPMIAHDSPHFEWLIGDKRCLVDLRRKGALAEKISHVRHDPAFFAEIAARLRERTAERFDWKRLKEGYKALYEKALSS